MVLSLIVAGCSSGSGDARQNGFNANVFNGGDRALNYKFSEGMPPELIRDQGIGSFSVRLELENVGEFDIISNSAHVVLAGFNPVDLNLESTSKSILAMNGVRKQGSNTIPGGRGQVIFNNLKYQPSVVSGVMPLTIYADVCFPYQTRSIAQVCINGNTIPSIDDRNQICDLTGDKNVANSGGPIKVENFKQFPAGESTIQFQFDIVHTPQSDLADVFEPNVIDNNCRINGFSKSSSDAVSYKDKIKYTVETGIAGLDCGGTNTGTDVATLSGTRTTVVCTQETLGEAEYQKPISITLDYDYLDRISKTINVEHVSR